MSKSTNTKENGFEKHIVDHLVNTNGYVLRSPIYNETAAYGHMGRKNEVVKKTFERFDGITKELEVELFTWEKLDYVAKVKTAFSI